MRLHIDRGGRLHTVVPASLRLFLDGCAAVCSEGLNFLYSAASSSGTLNAEKNSFF